MVSMKKPLLLIFGILCTGLLVLASITVKRMVSVKQDGNAVAESRSARVQRLSNFIRPGITLKQADELIGWQSSTDSYCNYWTDKESFSVIASEKGVIYDVRDGYRNKHFQLLDEPPGVYEESELEFYSLQNQLAGKPDFWDRDSKPIMPAGIQPAASLLKHDTDSFSQIYQFDNIGKGESLVFGQLNRGVESTHPIIMKKIDNNWQVLNNLGRLEGGWVYLAADPSGQQLIALLEWQIESPGWFYDIITSNDGGLSWKAVGVLKKIDYLADFESLAMSKEGVGRITIKIDYQDDDKNGLYHYYTKDGGRSWSPPVKVSQPLPANEVNHYSRQPIQLEQ
jgi:hypothetical protein